LEEIFNILFISDFSKEKALRIFAKVTLLIINILCFALKSLKIRFITRGWDKSHRLTSLTFHSFLPFAPRFSMIDFVFWKQNKEPKKHLYHSDVSQSL